MRGAIPTNWYGVEGRATHQAVWTMTTVGQFAKDTRRAATATLFDIQKAFDNIKWAHVVRLAVAVSFPQNLLKLLYRLHSNKRIILVEKTVAAESTPRVSVVAGCAYADQLMFVMMKEVDRRVRCMAPAARTAVVADDYQILSMDDTPPPCTKNKMAVNIQAEATATALKAFSDLDLSVAINKLATLATDTRTADDLISIVRSLKKSVARHARNLGVDFTLRKARRTSTFTARLSKATQKADRLVKARRRGVGTGQYARALLNSATCWGAAVTGALATQVRARRALIHRTVVRMPSGRSTTVDLNMMAKKPWTMDPAYALRIDPVVTTATAVWDAWLPRKWITANWTTYFDRVADGSTKWQAATHPVQVMALSLAWIGWTSAKPLTLMTSEGTSIDLTKRVRGH